MRITTWLVVMIVLWAVLITGIVLGEQLLLAAATGGFAVITVERFENRRNKRSAPVQSRCLQQIGTTHKSHPCTLPADGHTMHRCAFGDCEWGHR